MSLAAKLRRAPLRLATGAFILNAGVGKLSADEGTAQYLHGAGAGAYPVLKKVEPTVFAKVLAFSEIGVGAALLLPIIPAGLAGLALIGFSGALVGMYIRTPGMHDKYLRPNQEGTPSRRTSGCWAPASPWSLTPRSASPRSPPPSSGLPLLGQVRRSRVTASPRCE